MAHPQHQISTLKGPLQREKELKIEYSRKVELAGLSSPQELEDEQDVEGDDARDSVDKWKARMHPIAARGKGRKHRTFRSRGSAGSGGRLSLAEKTGLALASDHKKEVRECRRECFLTTSNSAKKTRNNQQILCNLPFRLQLLYPRVLRLPRMAWTLYSRMSSTAHHPHLSLTQAHHCATVC